MTDIRVISSSETSLKIRLPLDLLALSGISIPKPQLNQHLIRHHEVCPVFIQLDSVLEGFQIADTPSRASKSNSNSKSKTKSTYKSTTQTSSKSKAKSTEEVQKCNLDACDQEPLESICRKKQQSADSERKCTCQVENCGRQFRDIAKLRRHMLIHTGEKPFRCEICRKCFSLDFNLKSHLLIHAGLKPFQCRFSTCTKRFAQLSNLSAHERIHLKAGGKLELRSVRIVDDEAMNSQVVRPRKILPLKAQSFEMLSNLNPSISASALPTINFIISALCLRAKMKL